MNRLAGKRALVTGGTTGIGLETAKRFLAEGARVAVTGKNPETLDAARKDLGNAALVLASDAADVPGQRALAGKIGAAFGQLDVLFVNAGIADLRTVEKWDEEGFDRSFAINVKGPFFLIRALLPFFANPASIVLMTSINSHVGMPATSVYGASKGALLSLAKTLSGEFVSRGIRVNAISGGPIATPLYGKLGMNDQALRGLEDQIPVHRMGKPAEVADAAIFFASDESAFTVGAELIVDGGMSTL